MGVISRSVTIIYWQENMSPEDVPPRWMWALDDELTRHFERMKERQPGDYDDDPPAGPMLVNEHAKNRGRNLR